ncbi:MAG: hypothetical protein ACI97N_000984, partial [Cognaticolwellia sp.]
DFELAVYLINMRNVISIRFGMTFLILAIPLPFIEKRGLK